jgi:ADP-L-glycero-D-manno-heptose 6-epimerase
MIVVTGGAGFIGSALIWRLNQLGEEKIVIIDELGTDDKWKNLVGLKFCEFMNKDEFIKRVKDENVPFDVSSVIHMGACSATTERDADYLMRNNHQYSVELCKYCLPRHARFIYASSAATYGDGSNGYMDDENNLNSLKPLNMYGYSKHLFDLWVKKNKLSDKVAGLKFFNVYGPNEYHKGDMRSLIHKAFGQINECGKVKLFKSYIPEYKDGEQKRDFVYIKDIVDMTLFFLQNPDKNGLFNAGSGQARSWNDLVTAIFNAMGKPVNIEYVEMPESIRGKYQYFTQAVLTKIQGIGYNKPVSTIEEGVNDYVKNYLMTGRHLAL